MSNPLHAAHYADCATQARVTVVENVRLARDTYRVRFHCPELARCVRPGQFVMLRLADCNDPLLGRPLALYDTVLNDAGEPIGVDVVYLVLGKMTRRLAGYFPGQTLNVWGPLGNGFPLRRCEHLILVAGGIGQTPFPAVAAETLGLRTYGEPLRTAPGERLAGRVSLCYGARSADLLAGVDDFRRLGVELHLTTDDGSAGEQGFVTAPLRRLLDESVDLETRVMVCGPEPMMERVAEMCLERGVGCDVSLETPMACGIGICFSCVAKVRDADGGWDYKRTCVEGPVFDAAELEW